MRTILSIAALALTTSPILAQTPGAHLELRTATGQTTFHIGERIPLILSFTGPEKTYETILYNFGRIDPLNLDSFAITPTTGWSDSLATYAALSEGGCCGARQVGKLSPAPTTIAVDLNEWARFDEPGTYTLTVTSHRIILPGKSIFSIRTDLPSNPLQLHIIPATPAWQRTTLAHALKALAIPDDDTAAQISPQRLAAVADLRYLDSPPAIAALASNLLVDYDFLTVNAMTGLIGLPRKLRDVGLAATNALIDDPTFPISSDFLQTVAWLQIEDPPLPTPKTPEEYQRFRAAHQAAMQPFLDAAWQATASQLPRKTALARSVTAQTLLATQPAHPSPESLQLIGAVLRESFPTLSESDKQSLLEDQWESLRSRSLLPQLRAIAIEQPTEADRQTFSFGKSLRVLALARWYDLDPEAATNEILRQLDTKTPALSADDLDFLPKQTFPQFPQFEDLWTQGFTQPGNSRESQNAALLLLRFGTGASAPRLINLITQPTSDFVCDRIDEALAYLIKFDPQSARRFLIHPLSTSPTQGFDCYTRPFDFIGTLIQDPLLTEAALAAIKSTNPDTVVSGLMYLRKFDDDSARAPILARYLQWSESQRTAPATPDEDILTDHPDDPTYPQRYLKFELGDQLAQALLANQAWLPDADLIATVKDHCVLEKICGIVKDLITPDVTVTVTPPVFQTSLHIGPFDPATLDLFEAKLDQFPKGTVFTLDHVSTGNDFAQNKLEATMPGLFAKHGMTLKTH